MPVVTEYLKVATRGNAHVVNLTDDVDSVVAQSGLASGLVNVSVVGSTAAVTTCEYEPGLVRDVPELMDRLIPPGPYHHDQTWHDGNGHSHLRASVIGPSVTIPFVGGKLILGTWQQIVCIDFDCRPRERTIAVQILGE